MKSYGIFEVQKYGTTIEWTRKLTEAESAFNAASPGGVTLMQIDTGTANKVILKRR